MAFTEEERNDARRMEQAPPDAVRGRLARVIQAAIQAEFDRFLGAGQWERSATRRGWRNGSKRRRLHTRVGTLELRIPKDREGRFQPSLFERDQRSEKAFVLALVEMYLQGVSTRKVQKGVEQLCGVLVSASQVSTDAYRTAVLEGLRDVWAAPVREEAEARLVRLVEGFRKSVPKLAEWLEETANETLSCYGLPAGVHRKRLRSTHSIEHDHAEVRRRTRVVRIFPNVESRVRLTTALAIERNEPWMERRYLTMNEDTPTKIEARQSA